MIPTESAIHRVRRDITLGMLLKFAFLLAVVACLLFAPQSAKIVALMTVGAAWLGLTVTSARTSRMDEPVSSIHLCVVSMAAPFQFL